MIPAPDEKQKASLPSLREDLQLLPAGSEWTGAPSWLIHDPLRNRYFRVGAKAVAMLSAWRPVEPERIISRVEETTGERVSEAEVEGFARFLLANSLVLDTRQDRWREIWQQGAAARKPLWQRIIHNYLFFRIPLVRPQTFLDYTWPIVAPLFTRSFAIILASFAVIALYLVSRQWDVFFATFMAFLSLEGFLIYGASLVFIKAVHELGHAFMARKYGVHVPVIGIAFILLMPILYTDTTGAHRLQRRSSKLNIDLAGIYAELALAVFATLFWVFLPDGPLRSVAFSTATLSWVLSLAINLNPFMRFDGYYVLSDAIGFENLQDRGFALARWRLRQILFGLQKPPPEFLPSRWRNAIILHAWGTWIYRFFLFLGIALLVYHFFIKVIGIALFIIEICWFILLPIWREIKNWWENREEIIMQKKSWMSFGVLCIAAVLFFIPWFGRISLPAVARMADMQAIHAAGSAMIVEHGFWEGRVVSKGEALARLVSPDLEEAIARNQASGALLRQRLARLTADPTDQSLRLVLEQELASNLDEAEGLARLLAQLVIRADRAGTLVNVDGNLRPGLWLNPAQRLAFLKPANSLSVTAAVDENGMHRIDNGAQGIFIPDNPRQAKFPVSIEHIGQAALLGVPDPMLADIHGGGIATLAGAPGEADAIRPRGAWYPVHLSAGSPAAGSDVESVIRGVVHVEGERQSAASRVARRVASVLLRESGF